MRSRSRRASQPSKAGHSGRGIVDRHIAGTSFRKFVRYAPAAGALERGDDLQHAVPASRTQVDGETALLAFQLRQRHDMAARQINHMDVIAHAGAVRRRPIVPEHTQQRQASRCHAGDEGHQVVGNARWVFADQAALVRAHRVEVPQRGNPPGRVGRGQIGQNPLAGKLGLRIGVGCRKRRGLVQRHRGRIAIHRRGRTEHQGLDLPRPHDLKQIQQADQIVAIVGQRRADGIAHGLVRREMDDAVYAVRVEQLLQRFKGTGVAAHEGQLAAGDAAYARDRFRMAVDQAVQRHDPVALRQQFHAGMRTDEASAAGDKNRLGPNHEPAP